MENVKLIIDAIDETKHNIRLAAINCDLAKYRELMGNLLALENCLVTEVKKLVKVA